MKGTRVTLLLLPLAGILLAAAGCGGGGGGGGSAPVPEARWTGIRQLGTLVSDDATGAAADDNGNVYVVGKTFGDLDGKPNAGSSDIFLVKYGALGARLFTRLIGTAAAESDPRIAVDPGGNVYIAGTTGGLFAQDPAPSSPGNGDLFIARLSPADGSIVWLRQIGGADNSGLIRTPEFGVSIAADNAGNVYVSGSTTGILDGAAKTGTGPGDAITSDLFLMKLDAATGNRLWTRQHGTAEDDAAQDVAAAPDGGVVLCGDTFGILDGATASPGAGTSLDLFVAKFDPAGALAWVRQQGSASTDSATGTAIDNAGSVYATGYTAGDLDGNVNAGAGTLDLVLVKFDAAGNRLFTAQTGTADDDGALGIGTDGGGRIYVAGLTAGEFVSPGAGFVDGFLIAFDAAGAVAFARQFGSTGDDVVFDLAVGADGSVFLAGSTSGDLDGNDNGDPTEATSDLFVAKFSGDGVKQ